MKFMNLFMDNGIALKYLLWILSYDNTYTIVGFLIWQCKLACFKALWLCLTALFLVYLLLDMSGLAVLQKCSLIVSPPLQISRFIR